MRPLKPLYASDKSGGLRVVIFGAYGLLGHKLLQTWQELLPTNSTIVGAVRHEWQARALRALPNLITTARVRSGVDALHFETVDALLREERPHIVVNCIVALALPADDAAKDRYDAVNARFPARLAEHCGSIGARLIHISTDGVFDGRRRRAEEESGDAQDLYGRSKTHAEELLRGFDCAIIVRTSIIGRQLGSTRGMVEWILGLSHASPSSINGFTGVEWNGLTTVRLAHCLLHLALHPAPPRVVHLTSEPISKFALLKSLVAAFQLHHITVVPVSEPRLIMSLQSMQTGEALGLESMSWNELLDELLADAQIYPVWHEQLASFSEQESNRSCAS